MQLKHFNEVAYFQKLAAVLNKNPGLTSDKLAKVLNVNVVLMKEQIKVRFIFEELNG